MSAVAASSPNTGVSLVETSKRMDKIEAGLEGITALLARLSGTSADAVQTAARHTTVQEKAASAVASVLPSKGRYAAAKQRQESTRPARKDMSEKGPSVTATILGRDVMIRVEEFDGQEATGQLDANGKRIMRPTGERITGIKLYGLGKPHFFAPSVFDVLATAEFSALAKKAQSL